MISLPWYPRLKRLIAPTEAAANVALLVVVMVCLLVLWRGDAVTKALVVVYLASP
jgi:hypothetical protein